MKKFLAVILSVVMLFTVLPMAASAKVENDDKIITDLLSDDYYHLNYVKENDYFKTKIAVYTALSLYDKAWDNYFTGSVDTDYAKTILLALIDRFEEEYNNETYEEILSALGTAKTVAELIEKVDGYTHILELAENSTWATSLGVVNTALKALNLSNEVYEEYVKSYAIILSCQAANVYYGEFLTYIIDNCDDKNVKKAAEELKKNITASLEESRDALIAELVEDAGKGGVEIGIELAMDAYSVTAVIKGIYNTVGSLGVKLFGTNNKYQYMSSLAMLAKIEDVIPAYVQDAIAGEDEMGRDFAVNAILTIRETGEAMLTNLGKVQEDTIVEKLVKTENLGEMIETASVESAKLDTYRDIIEADATYKVYDVYTKSASSTKATVRAANGDFIATVPATEELSILDQNGAFVNKYNENTATYIKVIVTFAEGDTVAYEDVTSSPSTPSNPAKKGIFAQLIESIINAFKQIFESLFSFGKK